MTTTVRTRRTSSPDGPLGGLLGSGDPWTDLLVLAGIAATATTGAGTLVWAAGCSLSLMTGHGVGPGLGATLRALAHGTGPAGIWAGVPAWAVVVLAVVFTAAVVLAMTVGVAWWRRRHPAREGYGSRSQYAHLLPGRRALQHVARLRPSLRGRTKLAPSDLGVPLGRFGSARRGPLLRATWEDVVLAICAPRSGKTTCLAVPAILEAPGAVVVTSNKADVWDLTAALRGRDTRERVWTFDPQHVTHTRQDFAWDALDGIDTLADARRLAGHFLHEIRRADTSDFWDRDAEDLLTALILAAALSGAGLAKVATWLTSISAVEPRTILARNGFTQLADVMTGRSHGAHETREGVYATARAAATCLSDPAIMAWVTPQPGLDLFDPAHFVRSRQTLYLLSQDGAGSAAPLIAAFADRLLLDAVRAAEHTRTGRLDPPLIAVLDEAANICRITELPRLYSHLGSRGIVAITILQSRAQGRRAWGQGGMDELFSAATIKLIGAGIDDPTFADDISRLIGDTDTRVRTRNHGRGGGGASVTTRRERVLPADQVRALPKFTALLLATGIRPSPIRLVPWMDGPRADDIHAAASGLDAAS